MLEVQVNEDSRMIKNRNGGVGSGMGKMALIDVERIWRQGRRYGDGCDGKGMDQWIQ